MSDKHTPGPWQIGEYDYGDELWFGGEGCGLVYVNGWANGGCKGSPKEWDQLLADARLIAAAPEMFEALLEMLNGPECGADAGEVRKNAIAVIKKARGDE